MIEIEGINKEVTIKNEGLGITYYKNNIYSIGYIKPDNQEDKSQVILLKNDMDGNILDYYVIEGLYSYDNVLERTTISVITDTGRIYLVHMYGEVTETKTNVESDFYRISADFTGDFEKIDFIVDDKYLCMNILYVNGNLYPYYTESLDGISPGIFKYAFDEETLQIVEDDFMLNNNYLQETNIELIDDILSKYIWTEEGYFDFETGELIANIPQTLGNGGLFYLGEDYHIYCNPETNEHRRIKLPNGYDYSKFEPDMLDEFENEIIIPANKEKAEYEWYIFLDNDTYILNSWENKYFCRISTGEKTKIELPWSETDEKSKGIFKKDDAGFIK